MTLRTSFGRSAVREQLAVLLIALLVGCSGGNVPPEALGLEPADPSSPDTEAFWSLPMSLINPYLGWHVSSERRSGYVVAVAHDGRVKYATAHGLADRASGEAMRIDTRFRIASMTKPVVGVAAMILVERGLLGLDDPVSRYLPEFSSIQVATGVDRVNGRVPSEALEEPLRIEHLLTLQSGLGSAEPGEYDTALDMIWMNYTEREWPRKGLQSYVMQMARLPLWERPGERWRYGCSLDVLARVIEVAAGEPFETFLQREIFEPLGMNATSFMPPPGERQGLATLYEYDAEGNLAVHEGPRFDAQGRVRGSSGLVSTAPDYLRFALMLWNHGSNAGVPILTPESVTAMTTPHVADGVLGEHGIEGLGWGYALGVVTDSDATPFADRNGDFFWSGAYGSHFFVSPATGITLVVMQQHHFPLRTPREERRGIEVPYVVQALVYGALED